MVKFKDLYKSELEALYHGKGMSLSEIGKFFDRDPQTIHNWMKRHNIPRRTVSESLLNREHTWGNKIRTSLKGKTHTQETKDRISLSRWKTGEFGYRKFKKNNCERCNSDQFLLVHHKDENRKNNTIDNLETLCKSCHQYHHGAVRKCRQLNQSN